MALDDQMAARARSFGAVAAQYERLRPGYPQALFDDLLRYAGEPAGEVLEIGAGTGKATLALLRHGLSVLALEPSAEMAALLEESAAAAGLAGRLQVRIAPFEEIEPDPRHPLVVAAQSFHWIDPATRWQRLADALLPGGAAGLFWNAWMLDPSVHDHDEIRRVFEESGAGLRPDIVPFEVDENPPEELAQVDALVDFAVRSYDWNWQLPTADYLSLLATTSQYAVLSEAGREAILGALGAVLGARTELLLRTQLMLVRRADPG